MKGTGHSKMAINQENIKPIVRELLKNLVSDHDRSGLVETPDRVAKSWESLLDGYNRDFKEEAKTFDNTHGYSDIVLSGKINFTSVCEHHLLPFWGEAYVAYIPKDRIIGLSKLSRAVDIYSRRLQDQERITQQVSNALEEYLDPKGVAVLIKAQHFCNIARGVEKPSSNMVTSSFTGDFMKSENIQRFYSMVDFANGN